MYSVNPPAVMFKEMASDTPAETSADIPHPSNKAAMLAQLELPQFDHSESLR
jgi:hypothetical protein